MSLALLICESKDALASRTDPEKQEAYWSAWGAYHQALQEAGVISGGSELQPYHNGPTLRLRDGSRAGRTHLART